ncbi:TRAP transporter small permease [Megamonas funiformis]|nr:TRAP transporter small permease [Megamonas funiformis]
MVFCSFAQVVNRNFFQLPIAWFDEAATYCMIYMTLLGTEIGLRDGSQIAVTALVNKFKGVSKLFIQIISKIIVTIFSSAILFYSINMVKIQAVSGQTTAALHLPMSVPYMALVISFGIITVVQFILTIKMIRDLVKGNIPMEDGGVEK